MTATLYILMIVAEFQNKLGQHETVFFSTLTYANLVHPLRESNCALLVVTPTNYEYQPTSQRRRNVLYHIIRTHITYFCPTTTHMQRRMFCITLAT
jgi:hypothetical protein